MFLKKWSIVSVFWMKVVLDSFCQTARFRRGHITIWEFKIKSSTCFFSTSLFSQDHIWLVFCWGCSARQAVSLSTYLIIDLARCQVMLLGRRGKLDVLQPTPDIWLAGIHAKFYMAWPVQDLQREREKERERERSDFDQYQSRLLCPNTD